MPPQVKDEVLSGPLSSALRTFTAEDVAQHNSKGDTYIIVDDKVLDVSEWMGRHPGGPQLIKQWAGQDASSAFAAMHPENTAAPRAILGKMIVGVMNEGYERPGKACEDDLAVIRKEAQKEGLFKPNMSFYAAHLAHIVVIEALAWAVLWTYGTGVVPMVVECLLFVTTQAQAGWLQHDLGHLSVFDSSGKNHLAHRVVIGFLKAASASWWNWRHYMHHNKPNVIRMDPDVKMAYFFVIGDKMPKSWAAKRKGIAPYNWQHRYWFLVGPPFLLPVYFHVDVIARVIHTRDWKDALWIASFFGRWMLLGAPLFGFLGVIALYFTVRFIESHWFVWVTQMSHIPMQVDYHNSWPWVESQLKTTCNVHESFFNDWFTGHLNFQIEHHLFPTMPRHNYHKVAPKIRMLCEKHGLDYQCKTLYRAFADIVESLRKSGELWLEAYHLDMPAPESKAKAA